MKSILTLVKMCIYIILFIPFLKNRQKPRHKRTMRALVVGPPILV